MGSDDSSAACEYTERVLDPGEVVGNLDTAVLIPQFMRPRVGTVQWQGGDNEWGIEPSTGTAEYTLQLEISDEVVIREGPLEQGGTRVACPSEMLFDTTIFLQTTDGALDEQWSAEGTAIVGGIPSLELTLADPPIAGSLQFAVPADLAADYDLQELRVSLFLVVNEDEAAEQRASGRIRYVLSRTSSSDGEIHTQPIAEFN